MKVGLYYGPMGQDRRHPAGRSWDPAGTAAVVLVVLVAAFATLPAATATGTLEWGRLWGDGQGRDMTADEWSRLWAGSFLQVEVGGCSDKYLSGNGAMGAVGDAIRQARVSEPTGHIAMIKELESVYEISDRTREVIGMEDTFRRAESTFLCRGVLRMMATALSFRACPNAASGLKGGGLCQSDFAEARRDSPNWGKCLAEAGLGGPQPALPFADPASCSSGYTGAVISAIKTYWGETGGVGASHRDPLERFTELMRATLKTDPGSAQIVAFLTEGPPLAKTIAQTGGRVGYIGDSWLKFFVLNPPAAAATTTWMAVASHLQQVGASRGACCSCEGGNMSSRLHPFRDDLPHTCTQLGMVGVHLARVGGDPHPTVVLFKGRLTPISVVGSIFRVRGETVGGEAVSGVGVECGYHGWVPVAAGGPDVIRCKYVADSPGEDEDEGGPQLARLKKARGGADAADRTVVLFSGDNGPGQTCDVLAEFAFVAHECVVPTPEAAAQWDGCKPQTAEASTDTADLPDG